MCEHVDPVLGTTTHGSLSFLSSAGPSVPSLLNQMTTQQPHDAASRSVSPVPDGAPASDVSNYFPIMMNPMAGLLAFNSVSPTNRSPRLSRESNEILLWLTLPCMTVAPQAGSRAEAPVPFPALCFPAYLLSGANPGNKHQCAHLLFSSLLAPSFYNPLQQKIQISLLCCLRQCPLETYG